MKYQALFSLKNNEKIFMYVVCCNRDWPFKGLTLQQLKLARMMSITKLVIKLAMKLDISFQHHRHYHNT